MSSRTTRVVGPAPVERFAWGGATAPAERSVPGALPDAPGLGPASPAVDVAALEREAFTKGYAQGERAGAEAGAARAEAMLRRLAQTLEDLQDLRRDLVRRTERDVAELALAIATRVVHRELALDRDLVLALARVALDRLGDLATASIRLHPEDYATVMSGRASTTMAAGGVQIVPDPTVHRGGCLVQSESGAIDVGVASQMDELARALLGDEPARPVAFPRGLRDDAAA